MAQVPIEVGLFEHLDGSPRLVTGRCGHCHQLHFPELDLCPWCGHAEIERALAGPRAALWGHTAVTAAPPGYDGAVPFGFGVVELEEGLRVVTRLTIAEPDALHFGQPMRLVLDVIHTDANGDEVVTFAFAPDEQTGP